MVEIVNTMKKLFLFVSLILFLLGSASAEDIRYQVQRGDTLYSLSKRFDVSVENLRSSNHLASDSLHVDDYLIIPGQASTHSYVVERGDTLYSISRRFGIPLNDLLSLNNLNTGTILKEGDIISLKSEKKSENIGNTNNGSSILEISHQSGSYVAPPLWPVAGEKTSFSGNIDGIVIEAEAGSGVQSVTSGRVVWTGPYREFGQVVLIDNGEYIFFYGGNREVYVNVGETVSSGKSIGRLDYQNNSGRTPMFFTVFKEGHVVNLDQVPRG